MESVAMSMAQWVGRDERTYLGMGDEMGIVAVYDAHRLLDAAAKPFAHTTRRTKAPLGRLDLTTAYLLTAYYSSLLTTHYALACRYYTCCRSPGSIHRRPSCASTTHTRTG